ncbi:UreE urease accessory-like protein [Ketogulonicigenium robustum]|uniref:Urease accessory protein UreE n=1 Tax=Ketogulonicigenium robustum TaxID=92947 RepID=A0A1W6NXQ7_9RHOB|nr:urease accessory protein UreE [Ketogulonicigenium robustum]ARO14022.1 UreE urease accessory-like protein [Ketogulonicigenium robustum]
MTLHAHDIARATSEAPVDFVELTYEERLIRRKRITTANGLSFVVDLPETVGLDEGDAFVLEDGRHVVVMAADEDLMEVQGDLHRLAWHIGNRHAPCQIEMDRLVIRADKVMRDMLLGLGAVVKDLREPFRPEGGAYGHGRTMGHSHGNQPHEHAHDHAHDHAHHDGHDRLHTLMQGDAPAGSEDGHHHHDHTHDEVPNLRPHHHHDHKH